jgi:RNA polymerase sigma-70 factor (ECF subfamily)
MEIDPNVQLAASGDMAAFEEIYRTYNRRVYTHCLRMTRNVAEAEDLTQEVFIQVFRKLNTFRGESLFTTWLHRLTINAVLMHFRRTASLIDRITEHSEAVNDFVTRAADPGGASIIDHISLNEALRQLAPGYRTVFILHDVEGYEHHQIGEILNCAPGTSKSQLHKARMKLRRLLAQRRKGAEKTFRNAAALCAFAREKVFSPVQF